MGGIRMPHPVRRGLTEFFSQGRMVFSMTCAARRKNRRMTGVLDAVMDIIRRIEDDTTQATKNLGMVFKTVEWSDVQREDCLAE